MPRISLGDTLFSNLLRGSTQITQVYRGSTLIWHRGCGSIFGGGEGEIPPVEPTGYNFTVAPLSADVSVARTGTAWSWNDSQVLVPFGGNLGRIDYDPETGDILGLLVEPAATNLLLWGRRLAAGLSATTWVASNMTAADNVVGRDGVSNKASTLTATANNATFLSPKTAAISDYIFSAWVKRKTGFGPIDVTIDGGTNWVEMTAQILGGEWVRVGNHLLGVVPFITNPSVGFRFHESGDALEVDLCQLEIGPEATSEIPTEGATVTRNAETLTTINIPGSGASREWVFSWPEAAQLRGGKWVTLLEFSNVVINTSADVRIYYITSEPGKPAYAQTMVAEPLTL